MPLPGPAAKLGAVNEAPRTVGEFVEAIREGLVCSRCGRYVGSLAPTRYVPPPYPIVLDKIGPEAEVEALVGFEWHMLGRLRQGNFQISHPERDGRCVSLREWAEGEAEDDEEEEEEGDGGQGSAGRE